MVVIVEGGRFEESGVGFWGGGFGSFFWFISANE